MNTNFLSELKVALAALLAVLNGTNSPVKPATQPEPDISALWPVGTLTNSFTIEAIVLTNVSTQITTNWITDDETRALIYSEQVCRVRGHIWENGCGALGCLVIHNNPMRYCRLCGKVETRQIGDWK